MGDAALVRSDALGAVLCFQRGRERQGNHRNMVSLDISNPDLLLGIHSLLFTKEEQDGGLKALRGKERDLSIIF